MKKLSILFLLSGIIVSCTGQSKEAINELDIPKEFLKNKTSIIFEKAKYFPNGTHLSFAFIENGTTHLLDVKRENDTLRIIGSKDYIFEIGSISKVFTSTLLADAVIRTEVQLDDPIPLQIKDDVKITYKQLSNHTSGLPRLPKNLFGLSSFRSDNPYREYTADILEAYLRDEVVLDQAPNGKSSYSNLGAGLLGHVLSKESNASFETLLQSRIFSKYDMPNTTAIKENIKENLVIGRDKKGQVTSNWDLGSLQGAGAIFASASDLASFAYAHLYEDDEVLALSRKRTFQVNEHMDIALGWHVINTKSGDTWHWHNGGTGGYSSSMAMDVDKKQAVIVLSNLSAFHKLNKNIDPLCFELLKSLE